MKQNGKKAWLYLLPAIAFLGVFMVYPLVDVFVYSFEEGYNSASQTFFGTGTYNFSYVLRDPYFIQALKNTFILVIVTVPLSTLLALLIFIGLYVDQAQRVQETYRTQFTAHLDQTADAIDSYLNADGDLPLRYRRILSNFSVADSFAFLMDGLTDDQKTAVNGLLACLIGGLCAALLLSRLLSGTLLAAVFAVFTVLAVFTAVAVVAAVAVIAALTPFAALAALTLELCREIGNDDLFLRLFGEGDDGGLCADAEDALALALDDIDRDLVYRKTELGQAAEYRGVNGFARCLY